MLKPFVLKKAFNLRLLCLLFCIFVPNCVSEKIKNNLTQKPFTEYDDEASWKLAPIGKSGSHILRTFYIYETPGAIKSVLKYDKNEQYFSAVIRNIFEQQFFMTLIIAIGLLFVYCLLVSPYFIYMYRNKQTSVSEDIDTPSVSPKQGWLLFQLLGVALAIAIFGGILMYISVVEVREKSPGFFDLASSNVNVLYKIKDIVIDNFKNNLADVDRSASEVIKLIYNIDDDIDDKFMSRIQYRIMPVSYLAKTLQWDVAGIGSTLISNKLRLQNFTADIGANTSDYLTTLSKLQNLFEKENASKIFGDSIVEPLLKFSNFTPPNNTFETFDESIKRVEKLSRALDFQEMLQNISHHLQKNVRSNYDPAPIMEELRSIVFETQENIRANVSLYMHEIAESFNEDDKNRLVNSIENAKSKGSENLEHLHITLIIFSLMSASIGIFLFILYSMGVIGTKGFRIQPSGISHVSAKIIAFCSYFTMLFLALFLAASLIIFFLSAIPFELCLSTKDYTLIDAARMERFDSSKWYSLYYSREFDISVKDSLQGCLKNPTYFKLLPDPMVNQTYFEDVKNQLDTKNASETIKEAIKNLPNVNVNISEDFVSDLESALNVTADSYFKYTKKFLTDLEKLNTLSVLNRIKDNAETSNTMYTSVIETIHSYESFHEKVSHKLLEEFIFDEALKSANKSADMIIKQLESFKISMEILADFLQTNITPIYVSVLNDTVLEMIDSVFFTLDLSTRDFRRSVSMCPFLEAFYERLSLLSCEVILYPLSASWLGSVFVVICLPIAVFLCVYSLPLFLIAKSNSDLPTDVVQADAIPNVVSESQAESHVVLPTSEGKSAENANAPDTVEQTEYIPNSVAENKSMSHDSVPSVESNSTENTNVPDRVDQTENTASQKAAE